MKTIDDKVLHLYVCCGEYVSAHSPEDAGALFLDASGETAQAMADEPGATWERIPDDRALTVRTENGPTERETRTAGEWADAIGRGLAWSDN